MKMSLTIEESRKLLDVTENATTTEINKAYKAKILEAHPDKGGDPESAKLLNIARKVLLPDSDDSETESWRDCESEPEEDVFYEDFNFPAETLSKDYKIIYENAILQFSTSNCLNNFGPFYSALAEEGIQEMNTFLKFESFYCTKCVKHFVDPDHHFDEIIFPYIQMVTESKSVNIFEHLKKVFGNQQNFAKSDFNSHRKFWESSKWNDLLPIIQHVDVFTKELQNPKLMLYMKNLDMDWSLKQFQEVNHDVLFLPNIDQLLLSIQLEWDGDDTDRIPAGNEVLVNSKLIKLDIPLDREDVPLYTILIARRKNRRSNLCFICKNSANLVFTHCEVCGEILCRNCFQQKTILCMGFNTPANVCKPCGMKSDEHDAVMWAKKSLELLNVGRSVNVVRQLLQIANQYCKSLGDIPLSVKKIYSEIAFTSLAKGEAKTFIFIMVLQRVDGFAWGAAAYQLAEVRKHSHALLCLKQIRTKESEPELKNKWELLGDWMGKQNAELAMFCYRRCDFKCKDWISKKANFYNDQVEKEDKPLYHKLIFLCLEKGLELFQEVKPIMDTIQKLFVMKKYRLAVYSLMAAHLETNNVIAILRALYFNTKEVFPVILILKFILLNFPSDVVEKISSDNVLFCSLIQQQSYPNINMTKLTSALNNVKDVQSTIPLITHLKGHKDFKGWITCAYDCIRKKKFQASLILLRYAELCEGSFPKSEWERLGLKITEESQGQSEFAIFCFLLGNSDVNWYINRFIEIEKHNLAILLCIETNNFELLRQTGYDLLSKSKMKSAFLYFEAYVYALESWDKSVDFKIRSLQLLISKVFGNEENSDLFLKLEKSLLKTFQENIFCQATFPAHIHILKEELKQSPTFKFLDNLNAALHFVPPTENINETKYKYLLKQVLKEELHQAYSNGDFFQLEQILLHFRPTDECIQVIDAFLRCKLGKLNVNTFQSPQKAVVLLVKGTLEKIKGETSEAMTLFENAMDCYPKKYSEISKCISSIFLDDFYSHERVLNSMLEELTKLKVFVGAPFFWNFESLPILAPSCSTVTNLYEENFKNIQSVEIKLIQDLEKIMKLIDMPEMEMALCYCDLTSEMLTPATITGAFLMAAANFLKVLKDSKIPAEVFALQTLIFDVCEKAFKKSVMNGTSYLQTYTARIVFSILLRANKAASIIIKGPFRWRMNEEVFELIPLNQRKCIHSIMETFLTLGRSSPFVTTPFSSITDLVHMDCIRMQFFGRFLQNKCATDHLPLSQQKYIYYMYLYDGISKGWFTTVDKDAVKAAFRSIFLNNMKKTENNEKKNVRHAYLKNAKEIDNELIKNRKMMDDAFDAYAILKRICSSLKTSQAVSTLCASILLEIEWQKPEKPTVETTVMFGLDHLPE